MNTVDVVENLIRNSLQELQKIGCENKITRQKSQDSKLIFPKYRDGKQDHDDEQKGKRRISEQEARFLFVRELEKQEKFYYSIETPTNGRYNGFSKNEPEIGKGRSGNIDVTLYEKGTDKFERKHLIEFKFDNVNTYKKDFLKLLYDMDGLYNFYINIVDRDNLEKRNTLKNIIGKYQDAINELIKDNKNRENLNSILKIILFNIKDGDIRIFEDIDIKNNKTKIIENK